MHHQVQVENRIEFDGKKERLFVTSRAVQRVEKHTKQITKLTHFIKILIKCYCMTRCHLNRLKSLCFVEYLKSCLFVCLSRDVISLFVKYCGKRRKKSKRIIHKFIFFFFFF